MKLKSKHHRVLFPFFKYYSFMLIWLRFKEVILINESVPNRSQGVLLICNHFSWWDGFWALYANHKLFGRSFNFMMLERQLLRYWFFQYCGGYPIRKGSRQIFESLRYTRELLEDQQNLVLIFPQGKIESMYCRYIRFERGIKNLTLDTDKFQTIFMVNLIEFSSNPRPTLYCYTKSHISTSASGSVDLEVSYNQFYQACLEKNAARLKEIETNN